MSSEETRSDKSRGGSDKPANVVRIPRDWFGPREELVPFGPRAQEAGAGAAEQRRGAAAGPPPHAAGDAATSFNAILTTPLDPNSFWGEDASAIQDVVEAPGEPAEAASARRISTAFPRRAAGTRRWVSRPRAVSRRIARPRNVLMLGAVALVLAISTSTWLLGRSAPHVRHQTASSRNLYATAPARYLTRALEAAAARRMRPLHSQPTKRRGFKPGGAARATVTPVIYRPSQPAHTPSPSSSYTPVTATASPTGAGGGGSTAATAVSNQSSSPSSPPAFGANGALGPMSSPDG